MTAILQQEIETLQSVTHPNILSIVEILEDKEYIYIANELMEGGELWGRLLKIKNFTEQKAAQII